MKQSILLLTAFLICSLLHGGTLSKEHIVELKAAAEKVLVATKNGDADTVVSMTHSSLFEAMGGEEACKATTRDAFKQFAQRNIKFLGTTFGEPGETYDMGSEEVCILPHQNIMEMNEIKVKSTGYLVAVRSKSGGGWTFLDGAGFRENPAILWQILPKLPKDVKLPENKMEQIN